ncbi:MAG TPA: glutathione S-transferase family protein [Solirubrobacteraceae bacterium]|nr:glutathione S-transferase family protein [Solirubrobacteraceae bacterium]
MPHKLYVVHGSHPCAAVERAFVLKGVPYRRVELPPPAHALVQRARFGRRTVPALELEGGERVVGSRAILRRLEEVAPEPPLFPADPEWRRRVEDAERWGDEVWQPVARRLLWPAFQRCPRAMASYQQGSRLPALPEPLLLALAPVATRVERALNDASDEAVRADLRALPAHLDRIDSWIADGVLGGERPNAADLQIATTSRLLLTIGDVAPAFDGRPARDHALALFPDLHGAVPAGAFPAGWLAAPRAG